MSLSPGLLDGVLPDWQQRLAYIVETMRELSSQTDPLEMGRFYTQRMRHLIPVDASLSLSRRDLAPPRYRLTRSSRWKEVVNPWKEVERLPVLEGGLLAELIYGDEPRLIDDLPRHPDDPAFEYLDGYRSLLAIPMYDRGAAMNMVVLLRRERAAFPPQQFPEVVWISNLYGRATHNLVLSEQLKEAYDEVDHELKVVADIQRSLLPARNPAIPNLSVAAHYQTSRRAGGDYYDFFPLPAGRWGILIADVSGHGTPAAVIMAVTHSLAHTYPGPHERPSEFLTYLNAQLHRLYTPRGDNFVTAFYAIYDPARRRLAYSSAGHCPPRLNRAAGPLEALDGTAGLPLGLFGGENYRDAEKSLAPGDQVVLYTDGLTEAHDGYGPMFGPERLDRVLQTCAAGSSLLGAILAAVETFTKGRSAHDDRTVLVLKVL